MKKIIATVGVSVLGTALFFSSAPEQSLASQDSVCTPIQEVVQENLWDNPTEYYSLPLGDEGSNKSERLVKGGTYKVTFTATTYGESLLHVYAQNPKYLNEYISLEQDVWNDYEFIVEAKTNTKVVFKDYNSVGDINIKDIKVVQID